MDLQRKIRNKGTNVKKINHVHVQFNLFDPGSQYTCSCISYLECILFGWWLYIMHNSVGHGLCLEPAYLKIELNLLK